MRSAVLVRELRAELGEPMLSRVLEVLKQELHGTRRAAANPVLVQLRANNAAAVAATRAQLLRDALSSDEVRRYVNRTRPVVNRMAKEGTLLAVADGRALRFPRWQFDGRTEDGLVPGFRRVLALMDASAFRKATWFITPHPRLGERRPIDVLRKGELDRVLEEAKGVTSG
ncbi:MAG: hypothetical protein JO225_11565 [Candidatus Eremiobacteraeota bacterium]|nr:hypothetical protein [Candidatus Eremiobacteraeota bacterium]